MLSRKILINGQNACRRYLSNETGLAGKRFMQTVHSTTSSKPGFYSGLKYGNTDDSTSSSSKWAKHSLSIPQDQSTPPLRRSRASRFDSKQLPKMKSTDSEDLAKQEHSSSNDKSTIVIPEPTLPKVNEVPKVSTASSTTDPTSTHTKKKPRRTLRPRKALITLSPSAIEHLKGLLDQPEPKLIRIGVKNRGCSGLTYHLEYVSEPGKFDEVVEQDGVKVVIDSKALFSIVGSEMEWLDDKLSSRFIFKNPNSKGTCGCGESFMV